MSIIGIVCEFNPFHNGHKYLIDSVKKDGDTIVCVMSGNFVQRAEPAIFTKEIRTKVALENGVDIVLELPFVYATASAEAFCENAVRILSNFGCDKLAFGSENGNLDELKEVSKALLSKEFDVALLKELNNGISYPLARQLALKECGVETDISSSNDILAIEYIKAIIKNNYEIDPVTVKRIGAGYNEMLYYENFASATHIRDLIKKEDDFEKYVPDNAFNLYSETIKNEKIVDFTKYETALITLLRTKLSSDAENIANMSEGLENRVKNAIVNANSLEEIFNIAKTKRYTHSRIRRAVLSLAFDIKKSVLDIKAPYIRLLGLKENASKILGECAKKSSLPLVASYSDMKKQNSIEIETVFDIECKTSDFYSLILKSAEKCGREMTYKPVKIK